MSSKSWQPWFKHSEKSAILFWSPPGKEKKFYIARFYRKIFKLWGNGVEYLRAVASGFRHVAFRTSGIPSLTIKTCGKFN
jgi:hypothetical protein